MSDTANAILAASSRLEAADRAAAGARLLKILPNDEITPARIGEETSPPAYYVGLAIEHQRAAQVALLVRAEELVPEDTELERLYQVEASARTLADAADAVAGQAPDDTPSELIALIGILEASVENLRKFFPDVAEELEATPPLEIVEVNDVPTTPDLAVLLSLVATEVSYAWQDFQLEDIALLVEGYGWTDDERKAVAQWAGSVHLHASDNVDVKIPDRPSCLPEYVGPSEYADR